MNRRIALLLVISFASASCAPRLVALPTGAGTPFPDYAAAYEQATHACRSVRTMAALLSISGRAAGQRFRAKLDGGFDVPARVRLELPAPGRSIFVYVADGDRATLVFPREGRVLRDAPAAETLEALAGVSLTPEDLRTIVTGCGFGNGKPSSGRGFNSKWVAVASERATDWLEQADGLWHLAASTAKGIDVRYSDFVDGRPSIIRLMTAQAPRTDLTIRLSQVDVNQPLDAAVFEAEVPAGATPMTLEDLRQAGPLGR